MNDYNELIRTLRMMRGLSNGWILEYHSALYDDAADAIEQLVRERDELREKLRTRPVETKVIYFDCCNEGTNRGKWG